MPSSNGEQMSDQFDATHSMTMTPGWSNLLPFPGTRRPVSGLTNGPLHVPVTCSTETAVWPSTTACADDHVKVRIGLENHAEEPTEALRIERLRVLWLVDHHVRREQGRTVSMSWLFHAAAHRSTSE